MIQLTKKEMAIKKRRRYDDKNYKNSMDGMLFFKMYVTSIILHSVALYIKLEKRYMDTETSWKQH